VKFSCCVLLMLTFWMLTKCIRQDFCYSEEHIVVVLLVAAAAELVPEVVMVKQ
jgi:hypothetical protein